MDPGFGFGGRLRCAGADTMGVRYGGDIRRGIPSPLREESGGSAPSPEFFFNFWVSNRMFWCILSVTLLIQQGKGQRLASCGGMAP